MKSLKKVALALIFVFSVTFAFQAQAASLTQDQIEAILGILSSFNASPDIVISVRAALNGAEPTQSVFTTSSQVSSLAVEPVESPAINNSAVCVLLTKDLYRGHRDITTDGQVSAAQRILERLGYYTYDEITGFFGPATESAVKSFHRAEGIESSGSYSTTGYGAIGPRTRIILSNRCNALSTSASTYTTVSPGQTIPTSEPNPVATPKYVCGSLGDIDGKDGITLGDRTRIKQIVSGLGSYTAEERSRADLTGDGKISVSDGVAIDKYFLDHTYVFPGCDTSVPEPEPTITVVSPNGRESYTPGIGSVISVKYNSTGIYGQNIQIFLVKSGKPINENSRNTTARAVSSGSVLLQLGRVSDTELGQYNIIVCTTISGGRLCDRSDSTFTITASISTSINKYVCGSLGDIDGKDGITLGDRTRIKQIVSGLGSYTAEERSRADLTGDGKISVSDGIAIDKYFLDHTYVFPGCDVSVPASGGVKPLACGSPHFAGDVNFDGKISQADRDLITAYVKGSRTLTNAQERRADVNTDKLINSLDIALVGSYINGTITTFESCSVLTPTVDLMLNNSRTTTSVTSGELVTIKWTSQNASYCTGYGAGVSLTDNSVWTSGKLPASGSRFFYSKIGQAYTQIGIQCWEDTLTPTVNATKLLRINHSISSVEPSIIVTSSSSVSWKRNTVGRWSWVIDSSVSNVDIYLSDISGQGNQWTFAENYPNYGSFWWTVGAAYTDWNLPEGIPNGDYMIYVCPKGIAIGLSCGKVNVSIYGDVPTLSILSPAGGEVLKVGEEITVAFSHSSSGEQYRVDLLFPAIVSPIRYLLGTVNGGPAGSEQEIFTIPSNVPAGSGYTVEVVQLGNQGECVNVCALVESKTFTIVEQEISTSNLVCGDLGDINGDGQITNADNLIIQRMTVGLGDITTGEDYPDEWKLRANVAGGSDPKLNVSDWIGHSNFMVKNERFPNCDAYLLGMADNNVASPHRIWERLFSGWGR
ncbi:hypothetical protein COB55_01860 [Candidatus Wolfebacteria bacterium]|nr:MAG: hypothetical protein COB55_01860 [Candidatus Wolfebacteria bacterium]